LPEWLPELVQALGWLIPVLLWLIFIVLQRLRKREEGFASSGRADLSLYLAERAAQKQPQEAGAQRALGEALARLGRMEEAIEVLTVAAALEPGDARTHLMLGWALEHEGRAREAISAYERCWERDPFGRHGARARKRIDRLTAAQAKERTEGH